MREFLSQAGVNFEDRNIAKERHWRDDLMALTGEIVVPVLVVGGKPVVGLDEERMAAALGLPAQHRKGNRDGLEAPEAMSQLPSAEAGSTEARLTHFVRRLQKEMDFNAAKDDSPYRDGQHDGMRFARDGVLRILGGSYEPEEMVIDRGGSS